jgi:hypothetical protein
MVLVNLYNLNSFGASSGAVKRLDACFGARSRSSACVEEFSFGSEHYGKIITGKFD